MAIIGLQKGSGKRSRVREKSVKSQGILIWLMSGNPAKVLFSETAGPTKAKFNKEPPWVGGKKVCSRYLGHITKMVAMPIYGIDPSKIFSGTGRPISMNLGIVASGTPANHSLLK